MTELSCKDIQDLLGAYLDDELAADADTVRQHIDMCPTCRAEYNGLLELRSRIKAAGPHSLPEHLAARIRTVLDGEDLRSPAPPAPVRWRRYGALAASHLAVAALSVVIAFSVVGDRDSSEAARREIVASHIRATLAKELIQVASSDTHTVKPWLAARVPFSPDVRDFKSEGFPLIGGRVERLLNHPAAALVYAKREHHISVFVLPAEQAAQLTPQTDNWRGYHVASWRDAHFTYFATSDLNRAEFDTFVTLAREGSVRRTE
ncbi:MAG: zf-HC2 domain-containing protein [Hyphomicrobium sp.]